MKKDEKIFVTGHEAMIGSAILRRLRDAGFTNIISAAGSGLELTDQSRVSGFFNSEKPDYVFLAVPRTGGILANSRYPAEGKNKGEQL